MEQLARGDGPVTLLVREALTIQENSVEPQQPGAEVAQTVAVLVHVLPCLRGIHLAPTIPPAAPSWGRAPLGLCPQSTCRVASAWPEVFGGSRRAGGSSAEGLQARSICSGRASPADTEPSRTARS